MSNTSKRLNHELHVTRGPDVHTQSGSTTQGTTSRCNDQRVNTGDSEPNV